MMMRSRAYSRALGSVRATAARLSQCGSACCNSASALSRVLRPPHSFSTAIPRAVHSEKTVWMARVSTSAISAWLELAILLLGRSLRSRCRSWNVVVAGSGFGPPRDEISQSEHTCFYLPTSACVSVGVPSLERHTSSD